MKKYYKRLDLIRLISCFAVLFYHIGFLKGGYLAVCTFFVLSGYLSVVSAFNKEKFSIKDYYVNRVIKIYLPLLIVVSLSIVIVNAFTNFNWINLRPEVSSVLFGYNNYWQLNANLDYFVRNATSPFTHFWYIAILLQFELVFPIAFVLLKKIGDKIHKSIPCILMFGLGLASSIVFYMTISSGNIMQAYYGTFNRLFSLFLGLFLGFLHVYGRPLNFKNKSINEAIFFIYLIISIVLFVIIDSDSPLFTVAMLLITFISMRLIDYGVSNDNKRNKFDYIISSLSCITYEVYLFQYPVIFVLQDIKMSYPLRVLAIIGITFAISGALHYSMNIKKKAKTNFIKVPVLVLTLLLCFNGVYKFAISKDYTEDMHKLEKELDDNKKIIEQKQKEYLEKQKEEQAKWEELINKDESEVEPAVKNMRIVGIGDSVMELCVKELYNEFPNGYFDAATNRIEKNATSVLNELNSKGIVGDAYLFNLGTNGYCDVACKERIIEQLGDKKIFWVNATNPDYSIFNTHLNELAAKHSNVYIIDWRTYGLAHPEYLIYDGVHPNVRGRAFYAKELFNGVYNVYLNEFRANKENMIKEHEAKENNKITFIGNELLSSIYDYINDNYTNKNIIVDEEFTYKKLKETLEKETITNTVVLVFDNNINLYKKDYNEILDLLKDKKVYVVNVSNLKINRDNVTLIDFDMKDNVLFDNIHLSDDGKKNLYDKINTLVQNK